MLFRSVVEASIAVHQRGKYLLRRCPAGERWAGLWDFVRFPLDEIAVTKQPSVAKAASPEPHQHEQIALITRDRSGLSITLGDLITELRHSVTRYRITLKCFTATAVSGELLTTAEWLWVSPQDFDDYPLSVTGRKFAKLLARRAANESGPESSSH